MLIIISMALCQVAALCAAPFLLERPDVDKIFPKDAIARAKKILAAFKGGVGAYTDSRGNPLVREEVANFFTKRDGVPSNPDVSTSQMTLVNTITCIRYIIIYKHIMFVIPCLLWIINQFS